MPEGTHDRIPTVAEAVRDAAAICDSGDRDDAITALVEIYEDDDRPATSVEDLAGDLIATAQGIDPEGDDGAVLACAAAAAWLGVRGPAPTRPTRAITSCASRPAWPSATMSRPS